MCSAADPVSCAPYTQCAGNACASGCAGDTDCVDGSFCESGKCVGDGDNGAACTHDGQCASGHCVEKICCDTACAGECVACNLSESVGTCTPRESGTPCGEAASCEAGTRYPQRTCDGAGTCPAATPVSCAPYSGCDEDACATSCAGDGGCSDGYFCDTARHQCVPERSNGAGCASGNQCSSGHCVNDVCCVAASCGTCQVCDLSGNGTCTTAQNGTGCGGDNVCCGGTCQECCDSEQCADDHLACIGGVCKACTSDTQCGSNALCVDGACHACDVHCTSGSAETCGDSLKQALRGSKATLYVCPGTYQGGFSITRNVTIIGAGEGEAPAGNTLLAGGGTQRVLNISDANVTLKRVRVTHGNGSEGGAGTDGGGGIRQWGGALTMEHATVAHNTGRAGGGMMIAATLTMTSCTVRDNLAPAQDGSASGGGLTVLSGATLTDCLVADNTCDGEGGGFHLGTNASLVLAGETKVQGNTAQGGGGIYSTVPSHHSVTIGERCRITRNTAQNGRGGGIYRVTTGPVILQGPEGASPIVTENCHENCAGNTVDKCAVTPVFCPA